MQKFIADIKNKRTEQDAENEMARAIFLVEKELGCHITEEYLYLKFCSQIDQLGKYYEEQNRQMKRK